jgi:hypothetical protein
MDNTRDAIYAIEVEVEVSAPWQHCYFTISRLKHRDLLRKSLVNLCIDLLRFVYKLT